MSMSMSMSMLYKLFYKTQPRPVVKHATPRPSVRIETLQNYSESCYLKIYVQSHVVVPDFDHVVSCCGKELASRIRTDA